MNEYVSSLKEVEMRDGIVDLDVARIH